MTTLDEWTARACDALGLEMGAVDQTLVLEVARDVAHGVERPAAPVTTFLLGMAVARGADPRDAAATLTSLARTGPGTDQP